MNEAKSIFTTWVKKKNFHIKNKKKMTDIFGRTEQSQISDLINKTLYQSTTLDTTNFNGSLTVNGHDIGQNISNLELQLQLLKIWFETLVGDIT